MRSRTSVFSDPSCENGATKIAPMLWKGMKMCLPHGWPSFVNDVWQMPPGSAYRKRCCHQTMFHGPRRISFSCNTAREKAVPSDMWRDSCIGHVARQLDRVGGQLISHVSSIRRKLCRAGAPRGAHSSCSCWQAGRRAPPPREHQRGSRTSWSVVRADYLPAARMRQARSPRSVGRACGRFCESIPERSLKLTRFADSHHSRGILDWAFFFRLGT